MRGARTSIILALCRLGFVLLLGLGAPVAVGGSGWIINPANLGYYKFVRPLLFFSDDISPSSYDEIQGMMRLSKLGEITPVGSAIVLEIPTFSSFPNFHGFGGSSTYEFVNRPASVESFDCLVDKLQIYRNNIFELSAGIGRHFRFEALDNKYMYSNVSSIDANPITFFQTIGIYDIFFYGYTALVQGGESVGGRWRFRCYRNLLAWNQHPSLWVGSLPRQSSGPFFSTLNNFSIGNPFLDDCGFLIIHYIPPELGFTWEQIRKLRWGWWAEGSGDFDFDEDHNVTEIRNNAFFDNPLVTPDRGINPYTGRPYTPLELPLYYDPTLGRWVEKNRYLDPTSPPTVQLGSDGQWRYGRNPNGNRINPNGEGSEWYWDGPVDLNSPGITGGAYSNTTDGGSLSGAAALSLLQQIANNTGQTVTQTMGITTAIQGFRSDTAQFQSAYMDFVSQSRASLFNMLHNHHVQVQMDLSSIAGGVASLNDLLSQMSPMLGNIYGNTSSIDNKMTTANNHLNSIDSRMNTANDFLSSINSSTSSMDMKFTTANNHLSLMNGELQLQSQSLEQVRSLFVDAVAGSQRLEGHVSDIKAFLPNISTEVTLSACKELLDGMLRNLEGLRSDTDEFRHNLANSIFKDFNRFVEGWEDYTGSVWEAMADERIRGIQSLEYLQKMVDLCDSMEDYFKWTWNPADDALWWRVERLRWVERGESDTDSLVQINDKMTDLINEVASIPPYVPPEIPTIDLAEIESQLQLLVQNTIPSENPTTDLSGIESKLDQLVKNTASQGEEGQGVDLALIEDSLEVIKQRLQSIDRSVSGQMDVPTLGGVELDNVQKNFGGEANKIKDFYDGMSVLDELSFGFQTAWLGRPGNPLWWEYQLDFLGMEADLSIDFRDDKWKWFTDFLPWIKMLERFFIWCMCLIMCMRFAIQVSG